MHVLYGQRSAGRIWTADNQLVSTFFFHLFFIPAFPLGSFIVDRKGYFLDQGERIPLNTQSVLASYLRHGLFAVMFAGFAMMFDGLFLDSLPERAKPVVVALGTAGLVIATGAWLWATFLFGARRDSPISISVSRRGIAAGLVGLVLILTIMFGTAAFLPRKVTPESIAADRTISDAEAIQRLAQKLFPKDSVVDAAANDQGIEVRIKYVSGADGKVPSFADQSRKEVARIDKAATVYPMLARVQKLIQYGRSRHLSRISVSLLTTILDDAKQLRVVEAYRVSVPLEKFGELETIETTLKLLSSADKVLAELGVVELDHFSEFDYNQK